MSNDTTRDLVACGWADFCEARYDTAFQIALTALGFEFNEEMECFAFSEHSVMPQFKPDVAKHLASIPSIEFIEALELLIEVGRFVGCELEVLYFAWECVGISEEMWQTLDRIAIAEYSNPQQYLSKPTSMAEYEQNFLNILSSSPIIAMRLGVKPSSLVPATLLKLMKITPMQLDDLASRYVPSESSPPLILSLLGESEKIRGQMMLLRALERARLHIRSFLVFRSIMQPLFQEYNLSTSSTHEAKSNLFDRFNTTYKNNSAYGDLQWITLSYAVTRIAQESWKTFALEICSDLSNSQFLTEGFCKKLCELVSTRPPHLIGDAYRAVIKLIRHSSGVTSARQFSEQVQRHVFKKPFEFSVHALIQIFSISQEWNFLLSSTRKWDWKDVKTNKISFGHRSGFSDIIATELVLGLISTEKAEMYVSETREWLAQQEKSNSVESALQLESELSLYRVEQRYRILYWIRFADLLLMLGEIAEATEAVSRLVPFTGNIEVIDNFLDVLWDNCLKEDHPIAPALFYICVDVVIRVGLHNRENDFIKRVRERFLAFRPFNKINMDLMQRLMPPAQYVGFLCASIRSEESNSITIEHACNQAIETMLKVLKEKYLSGIDRLLFIKSIRQLRILICEMLINVKLNEKFPVKPSKFALWLEILDHRLFIEESIGKQHKSMLNVGHITPPNSWGATKIWSSSYTEFESRFKKLKRVESNEEDDRVNSLSQALGTNNAFELGIIVESSLDDLPANSPEEEKLLPSHKSGSTQEISLADLEMRLAKTLDSTGIWIKTLIDPDGRLRWWAFESDESGDILRLVTQGQSTSGAAQRIELETKILDAKLEVIWGFSGPIQTVNQQIQKLKAFWDHIDPKRQLCRTLTRLIYAPNLFDTLSRDQILQEVDKALRRWRVWNDTQSLKTSDTSGDIATSGRQKHLLSVSPKALNIAEYFLASIKLGRSDNVQRLAAAWKEIVSILYPTLIWNDNDDIRKWRDKSLNAACERHRREAAKEFTIDSLWPFLASDKLDLVFSLDGPLTSVPVEWLPLRGQPLFELVHSCTCLISAREAMANSRSVPRAQNHNEIFAALWEQPINRQELSAMDYLHSNLHELAKRTSNHKVRWKCRTAVDSPPANRTTIASTLTAHSFTAVVIAGHGTLRLEGKQYDYGVTMAPEEGQDSNSLWKGEGDFRNTEIIMVCACIVGRLLDDGVGNLRGLYSELMSRDAQCFCGARWAVHDRYAAGFSFEIIRELSKQIDKPEYTGPFRVARIVNKVRNTLSQCYPMGMHAYSSFSIWGIARHTPSFSEKHKATDSQESV